MNSQETQDQSADNNQPISLLVNLLTEVKGTHIQGQLVDNRKVELLTELWIHSE